MRTAAARRAIRATRTLTVAKDPLRLVVRARGARAARRVQFVIGNPGGALRAAKVPVVMYRVP